MAWALEKSRNYAVKSVYRSLMTCNELSSLEEGMTTDTSSTNKQLWSAICKIHVVPKVRVFWWRVLRGILPDCSTLKHRYIKPIGCCDICLATDEDLMHALISCSHAKQFLIVAKDRFDLQLPRVHPLTWARDIVLDPMFTDDTRCKIITIMHAIWTSRNKWTHEQEGYDPVQALKWILETL